MKKIRAILAAIFAAIAIAIIVLTFIEWKRLGGGAYQIAALVTMYGGITFALWFTVDQAIQGK